MAEGATITLPQSDYIGLHPHAVVCRIWPARPELMLVAVPLMKEQLDDRNEGALDLLVLDSRTLHVTHRLRLDDAMSDDAIRIRSVAFDTARYRLAPDKMAFGLRLSLEGSSRANPFEEVTLRLYAIEGDRLVPVLDRIVVRQNAGEWDTMCSGEFEKTTRTLSMDSRTHKGAADIVVTENVLYTVSKVENGDQCRQYETSRDPAKIRLTYDGSQYVVPGALKGLK
ncbi:hypothetical protein NOF55_08105 [Rhizobiaceae bacterium BDR2-2]|uniref:Uncharacterized protein n=1 Tax=Ectorhizobium quercum TaxID=2965071 RepID=A0AAE3MY22_9HYPH|nr:hypothetical protein [Ectorhizobium quercum]MCX8997069.1 hypothetical protein [Ectorhizobium quercum]